MRIVIGAGLWEVVLLCDIVGVCWYLLLLFYCLMPVVALGLSMLNKELLTYKYHKLWGTIPLTSPTPIIDGDASPLESPPMRDTNVMDRHRTTAWQVTERSFGFTLETDGYYKMQNTALSQYNCQQEILGQPVALLCSWTEVPQHVVCTAVVSLAPEPGIFLHLRQTTVIASIDSMFSAVRSSFLSSVCYLWTRYGSCWYLQPEPVGLDV